MLGSLSDFIHKGSIVYTHTHIPVGHSPCLLKSFQIKDQCKASYNILYLNIQKLIYEQLTEASKHTLTQTG